MGSGEAEQAPGRTAGVLIKCVVNYRTSLVEDIAAAETVASKSDGVMDALTDILATRACD